MQIKSLTVAAALVLGIFGCDDPEVQDKVADILIHGVDAASVTCQVSNSPVVSVAARPGLDVYYRANKLLDGSCFVKVCIGNKSQPYSELTNCKTDWSPKPVTGTKSCDFLWDYDAMDGGSSYPYQQGTDGARLYLENGDLTGEIVDSRMTAPANCGTAQVFAACSYPYPWFTYDITDPGCSGRNLAAFDAEE